MLFWISGEPEKISENIKKRTYKKKINFKRPEQSDRSEQLKNAEKEGTAEEI